MARPGPLPRSPRPGHECSAAQAPDLRVSAVDAVAEHVAEQEFGLFAVGARDLRNAAARGEGEPFDPAGDRPLEDVLGPPADADPAGEDAGLVDLDDVARECLSH